MNIIVCVKQVLDPEAPVSSYKVDNDTKRMTQQGVPPVISTFDGNALEAALQIKTSHEAKITVLSLGTNLSKAVLRQTLAVGADELILLEDTAFDNLDSYATASVLSAAIRKIEAYDLIFTGIQAADWNTGIVGSGIAEILQIPCITYARKIELHDGKILVKREIPDGYDILETTSPSLITVGADVGELRIAKLKEIMAVQKKPISTWDAAALNMNPAELTRVKMLSLFIPEKLNRCEILTGDSGEELGVNLALKLRDEKLI